MNTLRFRVGGNELLEVNLPNELAIFAPGRLKPAALAGSSPINDTECSYFAIGKYQIKEHLILSKLVLPLDHFD